MRPWAVMVAAITLNVVGGAASAPVHAVLATSKGVCIGQSDPNVFSVPGDAPRPVPGQRLLAAEVSLSESRLKVRWFLDGPLRSSAQPVNGITYGTLLSVTFTADPRATGPKGRVLLSVAPPADRAVAVRDPGLSEGQRVRGATVRVGTSETGAVVAVRTARSAMPTLPDGELFFNAIAIAQATRPAEGDLSEVTDVTTKCPGPTEDEFLPLPNHQRLVPLRDNIAAAGPESAAATVVAI